MGASLSVSDSSKTSGPSDITTRKVRRGCLVASVPAAYSKKSMQCVRLIKQGIAGNQVVGDMGMFLLTTAALEIVRRILNAKCPFVWKGLQALQILCYPPFRWIQKWTPLEGLIQKMQTLSKPMLALSIATVFSDESSCVNTFDSQDDYERLSESPSQSSDQGGRSTNEAPRSIVSKKWLQDLREKLDEEGMTLPERLDEDELFRFYAASNGDFSRFLTSVKKTIYWRQTYTMLSPQELEEWSSFVFWHGHDAKLRPCLIIRLGLACSILNSSNKSLFAKAVVSQIEHGVLNLVDKKHPQITVLMDCKGLSPFGFPMQMMRSCAILLQDHYPRRLACLAVIRLPAISRVITQTLFQVLKPATRKKLRIIGENYEEIVAEFLQTLPLFLGGTCSCVHCLGTSNTSINGERIQTNLRETDTNNDITNRELEDDADGKITVTELEDDTNLEITKPSPSMTIENHVNVSSPKFHYHPRNSMSMSREQVVRSAISAIIGMTVLWLFIAFIWAAWHVPTSPLL